MINGPDFDENKQDSSRFLPPNAKSLCFHIPLYSKKKNS